MFGLFGRFFPTRYFVNKMDDVAQHYYAQGHRHTVSWTKGTFLRFLGILIHMSIYSLPNHEWHWNYPEDLPTAAAPNFPMKAVMSAMTFRRYWQYCAMPGYLGGATHNDESSDPGQTDSTIYKQALALLAECV